MSAQPMSAPIDEAVMPVPPLQLRPVPRIDPPCLDASTIDRMYAEAASTERRGARYVQPSIPLDLTDDDEVDFGSQPTLRQDLPDPSTWVHRLMPALLECMAGRRPATQLIRWVSQSCYQRISRRGTAARRRGVRGIQHPKVLKVSVCEPADGVAEASIVIHFDGRVRAVALRLEGLDGRWVVTAFTVG